ncbi:amidohydrolase family protein [Natrarchaeobius oligotrophus]|uniref:Amidohydrolase n=1 Tax=Natrarchaeobius chitinivorans TaxID=1679083 RepID=A0A3N6MH37_NATCH|nr:amidohydrolase family protein [Natrarchaeobius chitinivorans]RQH02388.1 amidohydrolase [Natrarchaeobius chitinivorans]
MTESEQRIVDGFSHVLPAEYKDALDSYAGGSHVVSGLLDSIPELTDVDRRLDLMDEHGVDVGVLTPASPPVETIADRRGAVELARTMNDGIARIATEHPDRFVGVATVPMNDPDAMVDELDRAVTDLGLQGALVYSSVDRRPADEPHLGGTGRPIDRPELDPFYEAVTDLDVPIWLHPTRPKTVPEYVGERDSKHLIWQLFGWPFELSAAMARLVFGGVFERHPDLDVIAHHAGGMLPLLAGRMDVHAELFETFGDADVGGDLSRPYVDHFRQFYVDSATFGSVAALECALEFFGPDRLLFGTDAPFDVDGGAVSVERSLEAVARLDVSEADRRRIYGETMLDLLA